MHTLLLSFVLSLGVRRVHAARIRSVDPVIDVVGRLEQTTLNSRETLQGDAPTFPGRQPNGAFPGGDATGVFITHLDHIPRMPWTAEGEIFYMEAGITINASRGITSDKLNFYHSGIGVAFGEERFTVQLYAKEGMGNAIFPNAEGTWHNEVVYVISPTINQDYWTKQTKAGNITGAMWNQYAAFVVSYAHEHPAYQLWRVDMPSGFVAVPETICDSFSEASLQKFQALGATLNPTLTLKRNFISILAKEEPTLVDMSDSKRAKEAADFYKGINALIAGSRPDSFAQFAEFFIKAYAKSNDDSVGFVGSPASGGVFRVVIEGPHSFQTGYSEMRLP